MIRKAEGLTYITSILSVLWLSLFVITKTIVLMLTFIISITVYYLLKREEQNEKHTR